MRQRIWSCGWFADWYCRRGSIEGEKQTAIVRGRVCTHTAVLLLPVIHLGPTNITMCLPGHQNSKNDGKRGKARQATRPQNHRHRHDVIGGEKEFKNQQQQLNVCVWCRDRRDDAYRTYVRWIRNTTNSIPSVSTYSLPPVQLNPLHSLPFRDATHPQTKFSCHVETVLAVRRKITKTITERHYIDTRIATYFHCASLKYLLTRLNPVLHPSHTQFIVWTGPWTRPQQ